MTDDSLMKENCKCFCPSLFSFGGVITAMVFGFWCRSFQFRGNEFTISQDMPDPLPPINLPPEVKNVTFSMPDLHMGPWYRTKTNVNDVGITNDGDTYTVTVYSYNTCEDWGSEEDSKWKFTKAATVITVTLGGILGLLVCLAPCLKSITTKLWYCIALTFIFVLALFQGLTFLIYQSNACEENPVERELRNEMQNAIDDAGLNYSLPENSNLTGIFWESDCDWDVGSSANIAAAIFWFGAGASMLCLGAPIEDNGGDDGKVDQEEASEQKEEPAEKGEEGDIEVDAE